MHKSPQVRLFSTKIRKICAWILSFFQFSGIFFEIRKKNQFEPKIVIDAEILFRQRFCHYAITVTGTSQIDV